MFCGTYYCSVDSSGRIVLPERFCSQIGDRNLGLRVSADGREVEVTGIPPHDSCPPDCVQVALRSRRRIVLPAVFAEKCNRIAVIIGEMESFSILTEERWDEIQAEAPTKNELDRIDELFK